MPRYDMHHTLRSVMNFGGKMGSCDVTRWTKNCLRSTFQCDLPVCFSWQVVANCLFVLQEIWNLEANKSEEASRERETLLSKKLVYYLLNRYAPSWLIMSNLISFSDQLFFHCFPSSHMEICIIQNGLDLAGYSDFSLFFFLNGSVCYVHQVNHFAFSLDHLMFD